MRARRRVHVGRRQPDKERGDDEQPAGQRIERAWQERFDREPPAEVHHRTQPEQGAVAAELRVGQRGRHVWKLVEVEAVHLAMWNSTRPLFFRPSSVSFESIGRSWP